ncbi:Monooxygenase, FAD-binding protein [Metarhizium album ARSEF 1941]|uniref:Monooxygenase, FAD-binding protein n=1 Tax=Metarhizium album (strain ARSEF 1941) TaxID=1081103 RepID=A0A0B2X3Z5_METAS|nr:Monooxygenase, FAD-binding protein [Metarhizium album ARSEF 1941]KHO00478.1 Monooxygenase, FAD-binding protein [Metarhizium album ARSEF 1941]
MPEEPLRILIVGAGIAGPALAFWLHRLGHACTILERWDSPRVGGQQIDIRRQGIEAIKRMGITDDVRKHVVDEGGFRIVDDAGKPIIFFPRKEAGSKLQGFTSEFEIMRGDLSKILHEKTRGTATYRFGLSVDEFDDTGDVVKVKLSDGSEEEYDVLVGADGQGSRIRRALHRDQGGDDRFLRHLGLFTCYYTVPRTPEDENVATGYSGNRQRLAFTRWHSPDAGQAYLMTMSHAADIQEALKGDVPAQKKAFADAFKDLAWAQVPRLLDAMDTTPDFYAHELIQVRPKAYFKGRVVLLGDAGFCPCALTGMGTSSALVGAYILAGELGRNGTDVKAAFAAYDAAMRPWIDKVQALNVQVVKCLYPESRAAVRMTRLVLGLAYRLNIHKFLQNRFMANQKQDEWDMPRYEELHRPEGGS